MPHFRVFLSRGINYTPKPFGTHTAALYGLFARVKAINGYIKYFACKRGCAAVGIDDVKYFSFHYPPHLAQGTYPFASIMLLASEKLYADFVISSLFSGFIVPTEPQVGE